MKKNLIEKIISEYQERYRKKDYVNLIALSIVTFLGISAVVLLTYCLLYSMFSFIDKRFESILAICGGYVTLVWFLKSKRDGKMIKLEKEETQRSKIDMEMQQDLLENNYEIAGEVVFEILDEYYEILKVKRPMKTSEIISPSPIIKRGNFHIFQYLIAANGKNDSFTIQQVFQQRLNQKLKNHEIQGISQDFVIYKGLSHPIINVYNVKNCGEYYTIEIAFGNKAYFDHVRMKQQKLIEKSESENFDIGDDEDF